MALLFSLASPAFGQLPPYDVDTDGDGLADAWSDANENGIADAQEPGGLSGNRMEAECLSTARPQICLMYFRFNCQFYGFPLACNMANLGSSCLRDDREGWQYFIGILQANRDCYLGNQNACAYINSQHLQ
jgi:hypothetical protein